MGRNTSELWLRTGEACRHLSLSRDTLTRYLAAGILNEDLHLRRGAHRNSPRRWEVTRVQEAIDAHRRQTPARTVATAAESLAAAFHGTVAPHPTPAEGEDRCWCGSDAVDFTPQGAGRCFQHLEVRADD